MGSHRTRKALERKVRDAVNLGRPDLALAVLADYDRSRCGARTRRGTACIRQGLPERAVQEPRGNEHRPSDG